MPIYCWRDSVSKKECEILRNFDESGDTPTQEEAQMTDEEFANAKWKKIIQTFRMVRGASWNTRKGYH